MSLPEPAKRIETTENLDKTLEELLEHHIQQLNG